MSVFEQSTPLSLYIECISVQQKIVTTKLVSYLRLQSILKIRNTAGILYNI